MWSISGTLMYPLCQSKDTTWKIRGSFDIYRGNSTNNGGSGFKDKLSSGRIGMLYSQLMNSFYWEISGILSKGIKAFGAEGDGPYSRLGGRHDYIKGEGRLNCIKSIGARVTLYGTLEGQYSSDVLLVSEEIGFGGNRIGKGYNTSEITGDKGIGGILGLQYSLGAWIKHMSDSNVYVSVDGGKAWANDKAQLSEGGEISSIALGLKMIFKKKLVTNIEVAQAIHRYPELRGVNNFPRVFLAAYWKVGGK
jgi:hemolysin activation/secretion protein